MARLPRIQVPGGIFHITARGNRRQPIFLDDGDLEQFLTLFADVVRRRGWRCHAYCLMQNHYHLLIETPEADLSIGLHRLNACYAQWFNWKHDVDGHLFQGRFHSVLVESNWHLLELARYIALNPVRARLCLGPGDWRWSSYVAAIGAVRPPVFLSLDWLLAQFGSDRPTARNSYRRFVADRLPRAWRAT